MSERNGKGVEWVGEFGDLRLNRLAGLLCQQIREKMNVCLRKLAETRKLEVAFNRLMHNKKFSLEEMISDCAKKTSEIAQGVDHVLVIQDTTEFSFETERRKSRKGLGTLTSGYHYGFFAHPALAVDATSGVCLGIADVRFWVRDDSRSTRKSTYKRLPIEEKESLRWISTAANSKRVLNQTKLITIIADRESDIYEEWDRIPDDRTHLLTRARGDRVLESGNKLFSSVSSLDSTGNYTLSLPSIRGKRTARTAQIEVRFQEVEIKKPTCCRDKNAAKAIRLFAVEAKEISTVPEGEEPVHWLLLTTHQVETFTSAVQIINWYAHRWIIEQLFRTTKKQGLNIESSQIETGEALMKLAMLALIASVRALQLVYARDSKATRPYTDVFEKEDLTLLETLNHRSEGKTEKQRNQNPLHSLSWAAWIIARLGGWKGYSSERPPGPITMHNGLNEFYSIKKGWKLSQVNMCIP